MFSWQDTLQQRDNLTSCSKKQDLSQGHWKNDANFIAGATVTSSNGSFCRQLMNKYVTCLRSASSQSWIGKCPTTVLQLQHFSKIVQAKLVTSQSRRRPCRHASPCPQLSGSSCEGRRAEKIPPKCSSSKPLLHSELCLLHQTPPNSDVVRHRKT